MKLESKTSIRETKSTDALKIAELMQELGYPATPQQMRNRLLRIEHDPTFRTFIAECDNAIIGMIGVRIGTSYLMDSMHAQILVTVVNSKFRRKGIGKLLLESAQKWAIKQGADKITVISEAHQTEAHHFFHHENFRHTGYQFTREFGPPPNTKMSISSLPRTDSSLSSN